MNSTKPTSRCAKMDCHLEDTHWSLLGVFKHPSPNDWMKQLFAHEGMCIWSNVEYSFMENARSAWPEDCMKSPTMTYDGQLIYYNVKPVEDGGITLGLYTDEQCIEEYQPSSVNDPITVENVLGNLLGNPNNYYQNNNDDDANNYNNENNNNGGSFSKALNFWDMALEAFKICQPCIAYDVNNYGYFADDDGAKGSSYGTYRYGFDDDYRYEYYKNKYGDDYAFGSDFDCYDSQGETNVNQVRRGWRLTSFCVRSDCFASLASS